MGTTISMITSWSRSYWISNHDIFIIDNSVNL